MKPCFHRRLAIILLVVGVPEASAERCLANIFADHIGSAEATTLTVLYALVSLMIHVVLASNPGLTNFMHVTGSSMGAIIGIAVVSKITSG